MSCSHSVDENSNKGIRITLYKSLIHGSRTPKRKDFILWGGSDFLYIDIFHSLSELSLLKDKDIEVEELNRFPLTENRHLYIYKDKDISFSSDKELDWIFRNNIDDPLIVITLLKADVNKVHIKVREIASSISFDFDIFKTLGQSTGVIVFRCKAYADILDCIVQLNALSENTYSIAGVQNPFLKHKARGQMLFPMLSGATNSSAKLSETYVSIKYLLKEGNNFKDRINITVDNILFLRRKLVDDFSLSEEDLKFQIYFVIGRYDLEVNIEGHIAYILELLLNPKYGLVNIESKFYEKHVFESQTTWKTLSR